VSRDDRQAYSLAFRARTGDFLDPEKFGCSGAFRGAVYRQRRWRDRDAVPASGAPPLNLKVGGRGGSSCRSSPESGAVVVLRPGSMIADGRTEGGEPDRGDPFYPVRQA